MSELDQLLKQDPDFLPLNDWKKDNDTGDEIKNRKNYADYVRGEYVSAGAYSDRIENEISQSTLDSAVADGVIKADDQAAKEMLFTPDETDLDSKLQLIQTNLDTTDPAWDAATKYLTFKKLNPDTSALPEDIRAKGEQYFTDAQSVADTGYRKAVKSAVRSGELPLAKVMNDEGEYEILVSPTADAMNMAEAIRASKKGGVSFADAPAVQAQLSTPIGLNEPLYKFNRYSQAASFVEEFAKKDSYTSKIIQNYSDELAAADKDGRAPKSFDEYASSIRFELNKSGLIPEDDALSNEEVSKALTQIAYNNANAGGQFKLYDKPEEAYKNVRNVGFSAAFVHPAALVNDDLFAQSVTNNPNLSDDQKKIIEARREPALQQQFDATNELLSKSSKSDEWLNALQSGRVAGKKDTTIVKEFVSNPDNFSEIQDRLVGVGKSIVDGIGEMAAAVPMMMGADWARDYMVGNLKERSNRREVARLFGAEYGVGQDFFESLAPMLADMTATAALAAITMPAAGAGGAAFLVAKQGARLTAKGLLKGMTSSALRQLPTETAEEAAERLVAQGLIKASTAEAGRSGAMAAIKAHNSLLAKGAGVFAAQAVPSYNRSAGATYASVYSTLENNKDLTPEERHDRALGAALAAGATTALITGAFGAFGRSGLEGALLGGASRKQIKNVVARLSNVDDISDDVFNKVISKQVSETLKKYGTGNVLKETGKEIFKNSVDEGAEEGLDTFVNGFITDAATDEDTPFLEKLEQAARAALIGGMIGGGVPAIKAAKDAVIQRDAVGVQIGVETEFARDVSNKLTESGSPLTAQTVYSILTAPRRTRAPYAQAILEASRQQTAPAESVAEVEDSAVPKTNPTAEEITEALNNSTSPDTVAKAIVDERGQSQFAFVEDIPTNEVAKRGRTVRKPVDQKSPVAQQLEFDYTSKQDKKPQDQIDLGLDTSDPKKPKVKKTRTASSTKSIKKAKLADQLNLDFDSASVDEQNNHINANYSDEDLTDQERSDIEAELQEEIGQLPQSAKKTIAIEVVSAEGGGFYPIVTYPVTSDGSPAIASVRSESDKTTYPTKEEAEAVGAKRAKKFMEDGMAQSARLISNLKKRGSARDLERANILESQLEELRSIQATPKGKKSAKNIPAQFTAAPAKPPELQAESGQLPDNERIRMTLELFGALESGELAATKPKGKKSAKNIPAQSTAAPAKPPILGASIGSKEPMFSPDEFIDDELIGQEVAALTRIATLGYPVRLERKALHGMPQRGKYPTGYLVGKSDMVARKVSELYPVRIDENAVVADTIVSKEKVSFYDPKVKSVVRKTPKASIDDSGVGIFNNDPVSMKLLLDRRIPVIVPDSFVPILNPSFRTKSSGGIRLLNDIVMTNPETGTGFVSVLTKEDEVISSEPNYKYYINLSSFTALFNPEITTRSVPDPKGGSAEVTLDSIIQDADALYAAASSDRQNSVFGSPSKARATLHVLLKPRQGTLEQDFFEAAVSGFSLSVRKEAYLHELRLGMDKYAERKSGEATPSLKPNEIQNAIGDFISRTKVDRATAARNIAKVFGSDIDPETQPDLVLQRFIEGTVLVRPPYMPTLREIGAKVGNAFAEQQRTRDTFARKALFETTDPTDLLQIQDNTDLFDPEAEAADNTYIAPTTPFEAPDSSLISKALKEATFDATDALDSDPEMRASIDRLLRRTVFKGNSAIDITKLSSSDAFGMLASWMASGNYNTNPDAIKFQRDLRDGAFVSGDRMRRVMKLMYLSSKTVEGDPSKDDAYVESLRESLANSFGRSVSKQEASDFIKSIGNAVQPLWSRSYVRGEQVAYARQQNDTDVARLGLKPNDPESVIRALKTIASTEADANKRLLAKLLLENQGYIRQVEFSLDESPLKYAGAFLKASNGQPMISINLDGHNGRGLADVLLHEYTHAFVSISVASPNENLNAAQRGSLQRINGILELARRSAADNGVTDPTLTDGLENLNEFVTHFFTSTDFQGFLKALLPPTKQRGFFARMVDAVLDMFGLGRSKQSDYQKAFTDIVDLTREAVLRAPMTPAGLINRISGPASRTLQQVSEAAQAIRQTLGTSVEQPVQYEVYDRQTGEVVWTGARRDIARQVQDNRDNAYGGYRFAVRQTAAAETAPTLGSAAIEADAVAEQEAESIIQEVTEQDIAPSVNSTSAETLAKVKDIIRMVRRMVPAEFPLEINTDMPYAAAFQGGKILLNPNAMSGVVADLDPVSARGVVEGIMTEEAAHAASYNALTQQELDNYVATLKDTDFDNVIDNYYQTDELKVAAKARIRSEDPAVAAREREGMAEELLRMHSQKVTRGFTTEEDYMFWRSKPSLLKIVGRYMKGFINRYMAGKSLATMNGTQRATLQRMITEVRAINAGYRLTPNTLEFDVQNPHATMAQIATQLGVGAEPTGVPELMPMSAVRVLHNDSAELPKPDTKTSNRKIAQAIAEVAENYWGRIITSKDITQAEIDEIINNGTREFIAALEASGKNAADWYSTAIEVAMEVASLIHPELSNIEAANKVPAFAAADNPVQAAQFAMRMALAITSQNLNVNQNTGYAEEQFNILKQTGKFDSSKIYGAKAKAIQSNLELANILVNKFGFSKAEQFARAEFTVKELSQKASEVRNKKVTISGLQEDAVFGSAVFGPKIGQGFLQNLMSNFGPVTVDLWMRRTWGRWTGDVIGDGVTDERLAALLTGAREAGIALPRFASQLKITTRRKVLESGKLGAEYQSVSDSVIDRIESDPEYREQLNKLAGDLYSRWQKQYKLLDDGVKVEQVAGGKPIRTKYGKITKELLDDYRSGKADLETILKDIIQFEEKLDKQFAAEKAKAKEKGVPFKTKIADWRYDGYKNAGRTESLKDDISNLKPKWAKAAANIKQKLNPIDVPTDQDRRVITEIVNGIRRELESLGYEGVTNADIQAVLWYPEKDLWAKLAGEKESNLKQSYDDEFINIATQRGLGEEARQLAESIRADRATRNSQRDDDRPDGEVFGRTHDAFRAARASQIGSQLTPTGYERLTPTDTGETRVRTRTPIQKTAKRMGPEVRASQIQGQNLRPNAEPNPFVQDGVSSYNSKYGLGEVVQGHYAPLDQERSKKIAAIYESLPIFDSGEETQQAYAALGKEIQQQWDYAIQEMGISFEPWTQEGQPYNSSREMVRDVRDNKHLWFFTGGELHPLLNQPDEDGLTINDKLRAIHDLFGHAAEDYQFGARGEENAWLKHSQMFSPLAQLALTTETRGQNSWVNFGPQNFGPDGARIEIAPEDRPFALQKVALLPPEFSEWKSLLETPQPILPTQFGAASQLPAGFNADTIDYSNFLESLEMPMMEIGTYQSPKGMLDKLLKGELDPRILRLKNQRDFFNKATFDLAQRYKTKLDKIIDRDFGGIENAPVDLIQDATGSTKGLALPEDVLAQIEDDFNYDLDVIDTDDTLTADDKRIARGIALMNRNKSVADAEKTLANSIRTRRDDALNQLATLSPELVQHIVQLRTLTDEMSKKVASLYGFPPELKAKFDNQLGIYLTRSYKMFDEIGFGEKVLNDPNYGDVRDAAINFFEKQFIDSEVSRRISGANGVPRAQAEAEAKRELGLKTMGGRTYGQLMMEEFVNSYDKTGKAISATNMSRQLKPLLDNVQLKRDLPKEIRDLLGEKGAETGVDNLLRSLVTTGTMAANQSFLNNVRDIGRAGGWLITATELNDGKAKDYDTFGKYKPIRETTSSYDPLGELYGPPEMVDAFRKVFSPDGIRFNQTTAQEVVDKTIGVAARLSGGAMAAKTLGSIGFYVRNIVSNALFFAPAQGFVNFKSMATKAYDEVWSNAIVDPAKIDSYRTKLISLGVIGDDINTNIMTAMLRGGNSVDDVETKLGELIDTANKGTKPLRWLAERAQVLSGSVDAFYKIAYYENELRVLKQARAVDVGTLASASDSQLERMAADKVLATAQSSSQAPPLVQEVTKSGIGLLFAPFLRFKVEVPRIVLNTYKTAMGEMKSSNPVLKQRGITRFAGMTFMLSGVSAIVPAVASALAGIGEDEDEALRSSVPEYLRNHTFFYRRKADGQLQSWDFTFLNPFSIIADPMMRSMEQLFRGNPAKAAAKFVETAIFDQYLDDQILSSAVQSLRDNENPSTKKPIYEEKLDNAGIVLLKSMAFLFKEAYQPSVMKRAIDSYQAVGADYTEFDDSPAGILMREFYPVKRHDIELDKQLRNYLSETRDVYNRISERKNTLFSKKAMETDDVKDVIQSEIEDKAKINEDIYKKLRGFEGLGLKPQQLYQITTGMGYGKDRTRLLFNKIMDRPVLTPEYIKRLSDPENEQGAERLKAALEVLQGTPRYIMLEP